MKILILCACMVVVAVAEPPVNSRYLPPRQGNGNANGYSTMSQDSFAPPSQSYGAPQKQTDALFRQNNNQQRRPSSSYGAPQPSQQYGAPQSQPSQQYGAPSAPSQEYGAPSAPSQQYGAPNRGQGGFGNQQAPSQQYGAPAQQQSRQYLPPNGKSSGYGGDDDGSNGEPANYNFEYMVKDEESGNDFGHRESRMGDRAEGLYYVLLPDGRKQTVEYEADENGYRPKISYEDVGAANGGFGGYDSNAQSQGYQQNGY